MSKKIDKIIQEEFIPKWLENTKDLLIESIGNEKDILQYLTTFEIECKKQREKHISIHQN